MKIPRFAFWPIIILILSGAAYVQHYVFDTRPEIRGHRPQPAMSDTYDIYVQLTDDPRLSPGVDQVQRLVKEKGQLTHFRIYRAIRGKDDTPTTVTVGVQRNGISYQELVKFDHDGTLLEIISTPLEQRE